ncbi:MAG TPA: RsmB/NOP family class I SAM-dependent RNA methyltransferase [Candidatus Nanoarchaeia archaeon]|nr:RsmB/NOP family class I SAM-dependent RNA methyltransferase [Candidatus Nanoarchaeia archaeon]
MAITSSRMPDADAITYKEGFVKRYSSLTDWDAFSEINKRYLRKSIRVNTLKITVKELLPRLNAQGWMTEQIPWCAEGFFVEHDQGRLDIGNTLEHALGYIYVQEAASMIPPIALGVKPGSTALDLCAAPGSKTSQMAAMMNNTGALFANDTTPIRLAALGINLQRCGVINVCVTQMVGQRFLKLGPQFDYVLCDAPCSGTGTIRKSLKTLSIWNPKLIGSMAFVQKQLIKVAHETTKSGGTFVYSTCSLEPEENEEVVSWLLEHVSDVELEEINLPGLKKGKPVLSFEGKTYHPDVKKTLRIWPQDNDTEGFFVAKFKKK